MSEDKDEGDFVSVLGPLTLSAVGTFSAHYTFYSVALRLSVIMVISDELYTAETVSDVSPLFSLFELYLLRSLLFMLARLMCRCSSGRLFFGVHS